MGQIRKVCVYCGSSPGQDPIFRAAATRLGEILAAAGIGLVYGGGAGGMMGAVAAGVQAGGGEIIGIIPGFLTGRENVFRGATEVVVTEDMHERKRIMFERSDAFVALPGGIGTLEELVEQLTWAQLGRHRKPILIANINGFWSGLLGVLEHMGRSGFIHSTAHLNFLVADDVEAILPMLTAAAALVSEDEKAGERAAVRRL
ncbi:MAG TPA: TIGR00730 family Rossman fold protein [Xanthobacteraceae bacterium]|nr:TIGR00730 family Rossman fold protein [Xanthobacteraceae bacterium]